LQRPTGVPLRASVSEGRLEFIDFLRGVAIAEMVVVHYAIYFPLIVDKLVTYTETAMALFVLLAGFMVGWGCQRFERDPRGQTWTVLRRALRVLAIQYVMILTLSVPLHLLGMPGASRDQPLPEFVLLSMAFLNQIGLIHILPTFIPLFAVSPAILLALSKGWDSILLLISVSLFCVGHFHPNLLDFGQPTIFPFILFQLYFVIGSLLGKRAKLAGSLPPRHPMPWLLVSCGLLLTVMLLRHGKVLPSHLFSTHPLNLFGLMYHAPIIATLWLMSLVFWPRLERLRVYPFITRFGRHALLAFVVHVYLAMVLGVLNYFARPPAMLNYALVVASVMAMNEIIRRYELAESMEHESVWVRAIQGLFK